MNDFFLSDLDKLKQHLKTKRFWSTAEIIEWGLDNHSLRANRNKQILASKEVGFLRHIPDQEAIRTFGNNKQGFYEVVGYVDQRRAA